MGMFFRSFSEGDAEDYYGSGTISDNKKIYNNGYVAGYSSGSSESASSKYQEGYDEGYSDGYKQAIKDFIHKNKKSNKISFKYLGGDFTLKFITNKNNTITNVIIYCDTINDKEKDRLNLWSKMKTFLDIDLEKYLKEKNLQIDKYIDTKKYNYYKGAVIYKVKVGEYKYYNFDNDIRDLINK